MSKRMKESRAKIDPKKTYSLAEAIKLVKETSGVKFDASVEIHARLGIDVKKTDQLVRSVANLPHGTGKTKKVAAFVSANKADEAKKAGADFVYDEEDIKKIKDSGKIDFDVAITTPDMMPKMAQVAKVLGPRGLMPNPKNDTVGPNIAKMIGEQKKGKVNFKNDDGGNIHQIIGKTSFSDQQLAENFEKFYEALKKIKPAGVKGSYIKNLYICSSMGPSIKLEIV
ncbi:MAG: 50S ribosomal protein L1 [Candidatus Magasanikbacteria bacterium CG10_big_fil_rev_8_21_14_0_10_40_10]|uniref:Large ribosomal subunit protein uL1 n=1 Tax=Candidatus Magasanikbacteria bacterium CG10_big_fil_rev_8_21_14_0_10_40_10 TaxID=1974648 RepID=A0A2M6W3S5_9BACT|nr:MAG: 50S ribosomal protein L1 [Candidatus Magasanikbacteria bacterium CG10_big_fil_rev_8_21_14_0_10_40_10]